MALKDGSHEYILDRLIIQFEPDDPTFVRISHLVYDDAIARIWSSHQVVDRACEEFESGSQTKISQGVVSRLRVTRHYGPLALYAVAQLGAPEGLIQEALSHQALDTLYHLLHLICAIHPDTAFAKELETKHQFLSSPPTPNSRDVLTYVQVSQLFFITHFHAFWLNYINNFKCW